MYIKPEHFVLNSNGTINVNNTLRNVMNFFFKQQGGESIGEVVRVDFLSAVSAQPYVLRLKIRHKAPQEGRISLMESIFAKIGIENGSMVIVPNDEDMTRELHFSDPLAIICLFQAIGYEDVLTHDLFCLAYQVDLLQLLLAETLHFIIASRKISTKAPERIEFDRFGQIVAVVISPRGVRFQLKDTHEVCQFIDQYCKVTLPPHFVALIRQQMVINTRRYSAYALSGNAQGTPFILADNKIAQVDVDSDRKQLVLHIGKRTTNNSLCSQDRRLIQVYLSAMLGDAFSLQWIFINGSHSLIIKNPGEPAWNQATITQLIDLFRRHQLITQAQAALSTWSDLIGQPVCSAFAIPSPVEGSLSCGIMRTLPETTNPLYITPSGQNYAASYIVQQIELKGTDPFTREPLNQEQIRENKLANQLIAYLCDPRLMMDPLVHMPPLLINPQTNKAYVKPVVLPNGETVDRDTLTEEEQRTAYRNLCIEELMDYYVPVALIALDAPIERAGVRATIGMNISRLCRRSQDELNDTEQDELDQSFPYVDYSPLTDALSISFVHQMGAQHLIKCLGTVFESSALSLDCSHVRKSLPGINGKPNYLSYEASVILSGMDNILRLINAYCKLPEKYVEILQTMAQQDAMDILNGIITPEKLASWGFSTNSHRMGMNYGERDDDAAALREQSCCSIIGTRNILQVRAISDLTRMLSGVRLDPESEAKEGALDDYLSLPPLTSQPPATASAEDDNGQEDQMGESFRPFSRGLDFFPHQVVSSSSSIQGNPFFICPSVAPTMTPLLARSSFFNDNLFQASSSASTSIISPMSNALHQLMASSSAAVEPGSSSVESLSSSGALFSSPMVPPPVLFSRAQSAPSTGSSAVPVSRPRGDSDDQVDKSYPLHITG